MSEPIYVYLNLKGKEADAAGYLLGFVGGDGAIFMDETTGKLKNVSVGKITVDRDKFCEQFDVEIDPDDEEDDDEEEGDGSDDDVDDEG